MNANYAGAEMAFAIRDLNSELAARGPFDARFDPPHSTVVAGIMRGGAAVNVISDRCAIDFEVRSIPDQPAAEVTAQLLARAQGLVRQGLALSLRHEELSAYPALPPAPDTALARLMEALTDKPALLSVSYGTEAGLSRQAGIAAIICGPGSIDRAHRPDEYILPEELQACMAMLRRLADVLRAP